MAEPDPDRGHVDGPAPDVVAFVVPGGDCAVLAELAESALDGVALLIGSGVEGGRAAAPAAALEPVLHLVRGFGDGRLDPAAAQVSADRGAGVRLVAQDPPRAGPGPARAPARDLELPHQGQEGHRVVALPGAGQPRQRPAPAVSEQVDLAGQPAPRPAQRLPVLVILLTPRGRPGVLSMAGASRTGSTSAGGSRRAPAACWCARTTVASTATIHAWPAASSHPARSRPRIISQVPSPDQRRGPVLNVFHFPK